MAAYDFENGAVRDVSGNGNDGNIVSADCSVNGKKGKGCKILGSGGISLGAPVVLNENIEDFSIEAWGKLEVGLGGTSTNYFVFSNELHKNYGYLFRVEDTLSPSTSGKMHLRTSQSGTTSYVTADSSTYPDDQRWHHLVATKEGTEGKIYLDGVGVKSGTLSDPTDSPSASLIGGTSQYFKGTLDFVAIYNRALTEEEIKEHASL